MKKNLGILLILLVCSVPVSALEVAGSLAIDLDAATLSEGAFTSWTNDGTAAGAFVADASNVSATAVTVIKLNKGETAADMLAVNFDNLELSNRRPCNSIVWDNLTQDLFGGVASSFTVEIWVYNDVYVDYEALMSFGPRDIGNHWISFWQGKPDPTIGDSRIIYGSFAGMTSDPAGMANRLGNGKFNLFTYTYDKDTGIAESYVNGLFLKQSANVTADALLLPNWFVHLGGYGRQNGGVDDNVAAGLTGAIPKARVHTGVLSAAQVWANFTEEAPDYIVSADMPAEPTETPLPPTATTVPTDTPLLPSPTPRPPLPLEVAGSLLIDLDGNDLPLGAMTEWANDGTLGGSFQKNVGTDPSVVRFTGSYGDPGNVVETSGTLNNTLFELKDPGATRIGLPASIATGNDYTLEAWILCKAGQLGGENCFFSFGARCCDLAQFDYGDSGGSGAYVSWSNIDVGWPQTSLGGVPAEGAFHYFAYTCAGTGDMKIFAEGEEVWAGDFSNNVPVDDPIYLFNTDNCDNCGTTPHDGMPGSYGKIRVHDGVLTPAQILTNFQLEMDQYLAAPPAGVLVVVEPDPASIDFGDLGTGVSAPVTVTIKNNSSAFDLDLVSVLSDNPVFSHDLVDLSTLAPGEERSFSVTATTVNDYEETGTLTITAENGSKTVSLLVNFDEFAPGLTIYVDDSGNDLTGDGTIGNPYATIAKGVSMADFNAFVMVGAGSYVDWDMPGLRINVVADPIGGATIVADTTIDVTAADANLILRGFTVNGTATLINCSQRLTVDQCTLARVGQCIGADGCDRLVITDSSFDAGDAGQCVYSGDLGDVVLTNSSFTHANPEVFNLWGMCVGPGTAIVENCYFLKHTGNENCFLIWQGGQPGNSTFINNVFDFSADSDWASAGLCLADVDGVVTVYNNTAVANNGGAFKAIGLNLVDCSGTQIVKNNISVGSGTADINLGPGSSDVAGNFVTGDGNPGFTSPVVYDPATYVGGTGDFQLTQRSMALGIGEDVGVDTDINGAPRPKPDGTQPDAGAYEYDGLHILDWNVY